MKTKRSVIEGSSEFLFHKAIGYFSFEEDFMERNICCVPMIVGFKMDKAGIRNGIDSVLKKE
ncbi:MAG TPA: hypothetical protein VFP97_12360 [Chitinophagaceae bacterium]|nr:hypothetical protein [Chitinophagaceae bacterium]